MDKEKLLHLYRTGADFAVPILFGLLVWLATTTDSLQDAVARLETSNKESSEEAVRDAEDRARLAHQSTSKWRKMDEIEKNFFTVTGKLGERISYIEGSFNCIKSKITLEGGTD